jgi:hypothetical protein
VLREQGIAADIEVTLSVDPEDATAPELNAIVAHVWEPTDVDHLVDVVAMLGARLRAAGLLTPALPITFDVSPDW